MNNQMDTYRDQECVRAILPLNIYTLIAVTDGYVTTVASFLFELEAEKALLWSQRKNTKVLYYIREGRLTEWKGK